MFENGVLRRMFPLQGEEENGRQRKLHLKTFPIDSQGLVYTKYYKNDHIADNEMQGGVYWA